MTTDQTETQTQAAAPPELAIRLMLGEICAVLTPLGIANVTISYDGAGDEGQIENTVLIDPDNNQADMPEGNCRSWEIAYRGDPVEQTVSIADAIEAFGNEMLAAHHPGWENNDGAFGDLTIDVHQRRAELDHSSRYITAHCTLHELEA